MTAIVALFLAAFAIAYWRAVVRLLLVVTLFLIVVGLGTVVRAVSPDPAPGNSPAPSAGAASVTVLR